MAMWCPKCNKVNYNKVKCDFCGHVIEDASGSHEIPKQKKVGTVRPKSRPLQQEETTSYMDLFDKVIDKFLTIVKRSTTKTIKSTYQDKRSRGDEYEAYIANHYRLLGCDVIEYGKEKGVKDGGIDLIAQLGNEVILIQCKDWNENYSHKIDHKDIKVLRTDANDFLAKNPGYKDCEIKLRYTLSGHFLHKSAEKYIQECHGDISYEIIKPPYRELEEVQSGNIKKYKPEKKIQGTYIEKMMIGFIVILLILFIFKPTFENESVDHSSAHKNIITSTDTNKDKKIKSQIEDDGKLDIAQEAQKESIEKNNEEPTQNNNYQNVLKPQPQKSEREKAKEILLMQMKN